MGSLKNFVTPLHKKTKRNYVERMTNNKIYCSEVAKKYSDEYWDGDRKFGYGGYKYIPGRWKPVAEQLIKTYISLKTHVYIYTRTCRSLYINKYISISIYLSI